MTTTHHPIAILGGGLGGLMTARVLHTNGIESAVFDLEADRHARVQGGMLDIHEANGQKAIHAAGLWDEFNAIVHRGGESMRILDHSGAVLREELDHGQMVRPEVDRGQLRDMLIDSLPDGTIHWGHKAVSIRDVEGVEGRREVTFANGETITTDLLIGADGAWSKVRPLLTDAEPAYTGISFIEADLSDGAEQHPAEAAAMGTGMLFAFQDDTGILGHLENDGTLHVYVGFRVPEDWVDTIDFTDTPTAKRAILERLPGWDDALRGFVANADTALTPRRINALPVGLTWSRVPGTTLVGDAAHLMSPFAGEGANLAIHDGSLLALALADHPGDVETALAEYEADLFPRSAAAAADSAGSLEMLFSAGSPQGLLDMFAEIDAQVAAGQH
jgi:2-polyprenyl-6-methoxyphenol hydroxylase-like FAD-dependent oxidoreductase